MAAEEVFFPDLFEESAVRLAPAPETLANEHGWKVVEESLPDGCAMRWMVCEESFSLDQTRVKLGPPDASGHRAVHFTQLRATSHQLMALLAALAPSMSAVVVLGGGGMALPIAMLAAGYAGRVHVVELHPKVIEFAQRFFGAEHPRLIVHQADALEMVASGELGKLDCKLSTFLVDVDFMRFPEVPELFISHRFWRETWALLCPDGAVAVNVIGCDRSASLHSLVTVATACAPGPVGALLVEPEDAEHRTWTLMMPRAGVLILGPREQLQFGTGDDLEADPARPNVYGCLAGRFVGRCAAEFEDWHRGSWKARMVGWQLKARGFLRFLGGNLRFV